MCLGRSLLQDALDPKLGPMRAFILTPTLRQRWQALFHAVLSISRYRDARSAAARAFDYFHRLRLPEGGCQAAAQAPRPKTSILPRN